MLEREGREEFQKPQQVMEAFELRPGMKVADVGCGSGYFTVKVASEIGPEGKVWAIDAWQDMLDYLERRLLIEGLENVELVKVERDDPQIPDGSADLILMVDVYHYIKDRVAYGKVLRKDLAPGGAPYRGRLYPQVARGAPVGSSSESASVRRGADR